jgi:hypothetical protein
MCPDFRRGAEAIAKATEKKDSGSFRQFTPSLFWKGDGASKFLLFLNPISEIPTVDMIGFIPVKGKKANGDSFEYKEQVIARTDPAIGEESDPMVKEWEANPKETNVAVAIELDPVFEEVNGRKRPVGFEVLTTEFDRRIRDENGDLTSDTETIEQPSFGFVTQSPFNFFNVLTSYDNEEAPIENTPLKIVRVGDKNPSYTINGYPEQSIDLSGLIDCIDGISYLTEDERNDLYDEIEGVEDDFEVASIIGRVLLEKRLDELCDRERYDELLAGVDSSLAFKGGKSGKGKSEKKERPQRRSQRRSKAEDEGSHEGEDENNVAQDEPEVEEKPKPARRARPARAKSEDAAEAVSDDSAAAAQSSGAEKLARLKARQSRAKAKA